MNIGYEYPISNLPYSLCSSAVFRNEAKERGCASTELSTGRSVIGFVVNFVRFNLPQ